MLRGIQKRMNLDIFTDGSALKNLKAGWCYYLPSENIIRSGFMVGTSDQAELQALYEAFLFLSYKEIVSETINIYSDNEYALNAVSERKKRSKRKIINAIVDLIELLKNDGSTINFIHIDAYSKSVDYYHSANNRCDREAKERAIQGY